MLGFTDENISSLEVPHCTVARKKAQIRLSGGFASTSKIGLFVMRQPRVNFQDSGPICRNVGLRFGSSLLPRCVFRDFCFSFSKNVPRPEVRFFF